jgi:hypothetical protein
MPTYHKMFKRMPIFLRVEAASLIRPQGRLGHRMRWFRRNMRFGSWCALFALTIQLALSFGHLHFASSAAVAALASAAAEPLADAADDQPTPSKHTRVADYCTICASIHLAGLLTAEPPSVAALLPTSQARLTARNQAQSSSHSGLPFNARAPPLA